MRRKREAVLPFEWNSDHLPKVVREYREKYKGISRLLDENPEILNRVHEDLKKLSEGGRRGWNADFTSETILRALVVHAVEGLSLRETVIVIAQSDFLQDFLRTGKKAVMDFTFLDKCLLAIRPQTWRRANALLRQKAVTADKGFCPAAEEYAELEDRIDTLAIPRRMRDFADAVMRTRQAFRAGIEGTISGLKRAFRLSRCFYREFKGFTSAIGLGVFSHNLVVLAKQGVT